MTVDESQISTASASSGTSKAKATIVNASAASGPKSPRNSPGQFQQPDNRDQSPKLHAAMDAMSENINSSFEMFAQSNPTKAEELMGKLTEVTGMTDRAILCKAFDQSKKSDQNHEYNVTHAIEWILQLSDGGNSAAMAPASNMDQQRTRRKTPVQPQFVSPASAQVPSPPTNAISNHSYAPMQPPNSPSAVTSGAGDVLRPNNKPLVDLTDSSNDGKDKDVDADLEKAIQLSLQDVKRTEGPNFGVTQEEQDVSRALEASLMENQFGSKRTRGMIDYVDPLNPHDRERNGMWPVGLKNVGQTCWFSAVIQSLFYLPAFRSLVLNFPPPQNRETEKLQEFGNDRRRKIVEFMLELRKLFALMVGSQRKYVDPSRAVDILRGSIGTLQNENKDILNIDTNNQQDVSEFTHIVLEWVEEAFKDDVLQIKSEAMTESMQMDADCEKENNEEKEIQTKIGGGRREVTGGSGDNNPMSKLFYGKVLTEGRIHGDDFKREEAFGQWPLQVNTFTNIHESLENSLAHEALDAPTAATCSSSVETGKSGQERWFLRLPPVLFLELSRFHYNMERKTAEKIHNRLDFPERIFMDRYVANNKVVTRQKREEVRALKEKRSLLKARLNKFTHFGTSPAATTASGSDATTTTTAATALPDILQKTLDFAKSTPIPPSVASMAVSNLMQVDSPCGSPKMTPASSLTNLAAAASASGGATNNSNQYSLNDCDEAMDVEMTSADPIRESESADCDSTATKHPPAPHPAKMASKDPAEEPHPRLVTEAELRVLQDCLSRWKLEVQEDMQSLESAIQRIDNQIENMYADESLQKHEYQLHAVMVHEGSIDSGHYWAYVLDHKRKVWLKFNDNTVNEASWDELAKESMGGHSNTSAYSLVYIDTCKPELLLMDADWAGSIGETREEKMDQGELEALAVTLPKDLAQFVIDDNNAFQEEIVQWDKDQQAQKLQEITGTSQTQTTVPQASQDMDQNTVSGATPSDSNDLQVVEEKLTYINNHARLSLDLTKKAYSAVEKILKEKGAQHGVLTALEKVIEHYCTTYKEKNASIISVDNGPPKTEILRSSDCRLESFVYYLLRNDETNNMPLVELAVLEQFSFPGLENNSPTMSAFRQAADNILNARRVKHRQEASLLRKWHQVYHLFRRSVHCFVNALEAQTERKFNEALDLYTEAYHYTQKAAAVPVLGSARTFKETLIVRYLCKVLPEVNRGLIGQLKFGDNLNEVMNGVQTLIVPVLVILQNRVDHPQRNQQQSFGGIDAQVLEEVRNDWCALLGDAETSTEASAVVTEIIPIVLLDASTTPAKSAQTSRNRESVNQAVELNLASRYADVVQKLGANRQAHNQAVHSNLNSSQQQTQQTTPQQVHQLEP